MYRMTPLLEAPFAPAFYRFGAAHCAGAPQHEVAWQYLTSMLQGCDERAHVGPFNPGGVASIPATTPRRGFLRRSIARSRAFC